MMYNEYQMIHLSCLLDRVSKKEAFSFTKEVIIAAAIKVKAELDMLDIQKLKSIFRPQTEIPNDQWSILEREYSEICPKEINKKYRILNEKLSANEPDIDLEKEIDHIFRKGLGDKFCKGTKGKNPESPADFSYIIREDATLKEEFKVKEERKYLEEIKDERKYLEERNDKEERTEPLGVTAIERPLEPSLSLAPVPSDISREFSFGPIPSNNDLSLAPVKSIPYAFQDCLDVRRREGIRRLQEES